MLRGTLLDSLREAVRRGQEGGLLPAGAFPEVRLEVRPKTPASRHSGSLSLRPGVFNRTPGNHLTGAAFSAAPLEVPGDPHFGEYSCNLALAWAREASRPPRELARQIVACLPSTDLVREVRVEGPGFLNFFLSAKALQEVVREALVWGPGFLRSDFGRGQRVRVEPVAGGPPTTLEEGRRAVVAEALARLLEAIGHEVERPDGASEPGTVGPVRLVRRGPRAGEGGTAPGASPRLPGASAPEEVLQTFGHLLREAGPDVARFLLLQRPLEAPLDLDVDLARDRSLANPACRLQYAHARASGLLRMARDQGVEAPGEDSDLLALGRPAEVPLILALEQLPWTARRAARVRGVHLVAAAALELADLFHAFYNQHRILGEAPGVTRGRLALALAVRNAIAGCCGLMGIDAPERT